MVKTSRASGGVSLSVVAGIASLSAGILLLPFILREAGAETYGIWLILSAVATYLYYADIGVGAAISHFGARGRGGQSGPTLSNLLACGIVWSGLACMVVAPFYIVFSLWYVESWGGSLTVEERSLLVSISCCLLIPLILRPFSSALIGAGFLTVERRNQVIGVVVRVAGTFIACASQTGILGIAIAELVALLVPSLLAIGSLWNRKLLRLRRTDVSVRTLRLMLTFSYKSFGVSLVGAFTLQSGMLIMGFVGSTSDVSYYNAAYRIYSSVRQLLNWTVDPFRPALSRLFARDKMEAVPVLMAILLLSLGAGAIACSCLIIAVPDLVELWLGDTVPGGTVIVTAQVLLAGLLINMIHVPLAPATDAAGKPGTLFLGQLLWLVLSVGLSVPLAAEYGIVGAALGLSLPLLIVEVVMLRLATNALDIAPVIWFRSVGKPVAVVLAISMSMTVGAAFAAWHLDFPLWWFTLGCIFGVSALIASIVLNKRFGLLKSIKLLNVDL